MVVETKEGKLSVVDAIQNIEVESVEAEKWTFTDTINSGGYEYFGFQKSDGSWQIKRLNDSSMRIANITNNPTMTSYTLAWASYDSLTYNKVEDI